VFDQHSVRSLQGKGGESGVWGKTAIGDFTDLEVSSKCIMDGVEERRFSDANKKQKERLGHGGFLKTKGLSGALNQALELENAIGPAQQRREKMRGKGTNFLGRRQLFPVSAR